MNHVTHVIFSTIFINDFVKTIAQNSTATNENLKINDIADALIHALEVNKGANNVTRIEELKEKLNKINSYAINKEKYSILLSNVTTETDLNETNFFNALCEDDNFKFLLNNEPKNLYLQLKERMNRDDVLNIIVEKGRNKKIVNSARKAMGEDYLVPNNDEDVLDVVVDKLLGETPLDTHKYDIKANDSKYWDPQGELEDLKEYHKHDGRRIFRGDRTTVRHYPFMVSIHVMGRFWCGGSIYWHDMVLTSAACLQLMHNNRLFRENPKVLQVRVGSNHSRIGGELVDALEVYFHPGYDPRSLRNNIAIIRLRRHLSFNYHRIPKLIDIYRDDHTPPNTAEVLLLGWGVTKMSQKMSYEPVYLQRTFLPVYSNTFCREVYGDQFITQSMFCAGTFTTGEGACDHDAGGPAIISGRLVGIISFGPSVCGYPNAPTVFTLVGAYADWIETVNETMPSYYRGRLRSTTSTRRPLFDYIGNMYPETYAFTPAEDIDIQPMMAYNPAPAGTEATYATEATEVPTEATVATEATVEGTETTTVLPALRLMLDNSDEDSWSEKK